MTPEHVSNIVPLVMGEIIIRREAWVKPCLGNHREYDDELCARCPCLTECQACDAGVKSEAEEIEEIV